MTVWPFKPISPVLESLEWLTDVFRAKSSEQRHALRLRPRRTFTFAHILTTEEAAYAAALIRSAQGAGFYIPDWTASDRVTPGASLSSSSVNEEAVLYGDHAFVWDSVRNYERVSGAVDSNDLFITDALSNSYHAPRLMPIWDGDTLSGLDIDQLGKGKVRASITFVLDSLPDFGASAYPTYRSLPVIDDCPILVGGLNAGITSELSTFDNRVTDLELIRARSLEEFTFQMRWRDLAREDAFATRAFIASRYGRQKAFWASSFTSDLEPAATISGTTLTVFADVLTRSAPFDVEIKGGGIHRRQVTASAAGSAVNGRPTVDLTLDTTLAVALADISRISFLACSRFDSDRIEFDHTAGSGQTVVVPCREVPVP